MMSTSPERQELLSDAADENYISVDHRLDAGDTPAFNRWRNDTFHADPLCPRFRDGSRMVKVYDIDFCRRAVFKRPCPYCTTGGTA